MSDPKLTLNIMPGTSIDSAATQAQRIANETGQSVLFKFNSVRCVAVPGGDAETLASRQQEAQNFTPTVTSEVLAASAIEAQRAETTKIGSVEDESAVPNGETPK